MAETAFDVISRCRATSTSSSVCGGVSTTSAHWIIRSMRFFDSSGAALTRDIRAWRSWMLMCICVCSWVTRYSSEKQFQQDDDYALRARKDGFLIGQVGAYQHPHSSLVKEKLT